MNLKLLICLIFVHKIVYISNVNNYHVERIGHSFESKENLRFITGNQRVQKKKMFSVSFFTAKKKTTIDYFLFFFFLFGRLYIWLTKVLMVYITFSSCRAKVIFYVLLASDSWQKNWLSTFKTKMPTILFSYIVHFLLQ